VSKAFTKEDGSEEIFAPPRAPLPPGTQNYITKAGAERVERELAELIRRKRELAETVGAEAEQKRIEARIQDLQGLVRTFVVVEPASSEVVRFGVTVTLKRGRETENYTIVGVDEIDLDRNHISWLSPLARALTGKRVGERIRFKSPAGEEQLEILGIG
jgi:transcription elongation factor GreB